MEGEAGIATLLAFLDMSAEFTGAAGDEVVDDAGLVAPEPERSRVVA
jgi:hypothetical protein